MFTRRMTDAETGAERRGPVSRLDSAPAPAFMQSLRSAPRWGRWVQASQQQNFQKECGAQGGLGLTVSDN